MWEYLSKSIPKGFWIYCSILREKKKKKDRISGAKCTDPKASRLFIQEVKIPSLYPADHLLEHIFKKNKFWYI